jgi:hypothetical protein
MLNYSTQEKALLMVLVFMVGLGALALLQPRQPEPPPAKAEKVEHFDALEKDFLIECAVRGEPVVNCKSRVYDLREVKAWRGE